MAKNKNTDTVINIDAEEQKLLAQLDALKEKKVAAETARLNKIADIVRGFPAMLGVTSFAEVIALMKHVEKGTLGKVDATARAYVKLTDAQKVTIKERLAKGEQVSVLANEYGVSVGTVYNMKKGKDEAEVTPVAEPIAAS
jgi:hypothetical protein